jgi:hypothetical protein
MSTYRITDYTKEQARKLNVQVRPSSNPKKKLDVFRKGEKIASVGAMGYLDYPSYLKQYGDDDAKERRRLYKLRHAKDLSSGDGFWANKLLW